MNLKLPDYKKLTISVIGMGYVGLPLAIEFAKQKTCQKTGDLLNHNVFGFDIDDLRLDELQNGFDRTKELSEEELKHITNIKFTNNVKEISRSNVFIITVPTPIDSAKKPNLTAMKEASKTVAKAIKLNNLSIKQNEKSCPIIIYESTVYPGTTEEICIPIIEEYSELKYNRDFVCGYSPERINPGDSINKLTSIIKLTSGSTPESASWINDLYGSIITAGTHLTSTIRIAEAAKVIENTQRDLNIALVNELAVIFKLLNIDTLEVLEAASTKWNFLRFLPGLVGGHCIGVDPYYLTYKAEQAGYHPEVVLAGRRINNNMSSWIVEQVILEMARKKIIIGGSKALVLGLTFKENCPDIRNTKVVELINSLEMYGLNVDVVDPCSDVEEASRKYEIKISNKIDYSKEYACVIVAVSHKEFGLLTLSDWKSLTQGNGVIFDLKGIVPKQLNPIRP